MLRVCSLSRGTLRASPLHLPSPSKLSGCVRAYATEAPKQPVKPAPKPVTPATPPPSKPISAVSAPVPASKPKSGGGAGLVVTLGVLGGLGAAVYYRKELGIEKYLPFDLPGSSGGKPAHPPLKPAMQDDVKPKEKAVPPPQPPQPAPEAPKAEVKVEATPAPAPKPAPAEKPAPPAPKAVVYTVAQLESIAAEAEALLATEQAAAKAAADAAAKAAVAAVVQAAKEKPVPDAEPVKPPTASLNAAAQAGVDAANTTVQVSHASYDLQCLPVATVPSSGCLVGMQAQVVSEMAKALRQDLEASYAHNLDGLSEGELRAKVSQLSKELAERGKWEALRLTEFLQRSEEQWKAKVCRDRSSSSCCGFRAGSNELSGCLVAVCGVHGVPARGVEGRGEGHQR